MDIVQRLKLKFDQYLVDTHQLSAARFYEIDHPFFKGSRISAWFEQGVGKKSSMPPGLKDFRSIQRTQIFIGENDIEFKV